jgi:hypothetical protein
MDSKYHMGDYLSRFEARPFIPLRGRAFKGKTYQYGY